MRTFAMSVVGTAYWVIAAVFVIYATQPFAADALLVIAGFIVLFGVIAFASAFWSGARTRPWFWLVATVPGIVVVLFDGFFAPYAIAHPADALSFVTTLVALVAAILAVVGSLTAWLEVRRGGSALWQARGRSGFIVVGILGLVVGASMTSVVAASPTNAGTALSAPPATTATLTIKQTKFLEPLDAKAEEVLGIYVTNTDGFAHSFDVDSLGIHVPLAAASTTFVAIKPTTTGALQFYCAVPGHRDAGMVGSISVK